MQKKKNGGSVVVITLLILLVLGLGSYIVYDKLMVEEKTEVKKEDEWETEEAVLLGIDNANVISLFERSHNRTIMGIDEKVFNSDRLSVKEMDENYKMQLAYSLVSNKLEKAEQNGNMIESLRKEDVRLGYEQIFGPNTFKSPTTFTLGCGKFTYNSQTKKYENLATGCGGTTTFSVVEDIISATKFDDRIEIVSAAIFISGEEKAIFKDYQKKEKLKELTEDDLLNTVEQRVDERMKAYVMENREQLQQYTYTYQLGNDHFYYYTGVARTKS